MGAALIVAASLFSLGALGQVDVDAAVQAGASARLIDETASVDELAGSSRRFAEIGLGPRLTLANDARLRLALTYAPALRVPFESASDDPRAEGLSPWERTTVLHNLDLGATREAGRWSLRGGVAASSGTLDPVAGRTAGQPLIGTERFSYRSSTLRAGFTWGATRRSTVWVDVRGVISGGEGQAARQLVPLQQEVGIDASFDFQASATDTVGATLGVVGSRIEGRSDAATLLGGGSWSRLLTRDLASRMAGGIAAAYEPPGPGLSGAAEGSAAGGRSLMAGPWFRATLRYDPGDARASVLASAGMEPVIDRLSGLVDFRGSLEGTLSWAPIRDWRFDLSANAAVLQPWSDREGTQVARTWVGGVGTRIGYAVGRYLVVGGGVASIWQDSGRDDLVSFREIVGTVDLTATMPR